MVRVVILEIQAVDLVQVQLLETRLLECYRLEFQECSEVQARMNVTTVVQLPGPVMNQTPPLPTVETTSLTENLTFNNNSSTIIIHRLSSSNFNNKTNQIPTANWT